MERARRTFALAPKGVPVVGIDERTALIRDADGAWRSGGKGSVIVWVDGDESGLDALP